MNGWISGSRTDRVTNRASAHDLSTIKAKAMDQEEGEWYSPLPITVISVACYREVGEGFPITHDS
jgi:hypothetical protein